MNAFLAILGRDLRLSLGSGGIGLPVVFFLLVATLYPFAVGPDGALLAKTGGGVLWVAALLAALLPIDRLIAPDAEAGVLDQYAVRGVGEEMIAAAKITAHWIGFGPPLMLAAITNQLDWAKKLIERGADVNQKGWTPLHYAATKGNIEIMRLLIENHAYLDA